MQPSIISKIFNGIGYVALLLTFLLIYSHHFAQHDSIIKTHKLALIATFACTFFIHYFYLVAIALAKRQWWWAALLFIAPIPIYWLYFGWNSIAPYLSNRVARTTEVTEKPQIK